MIKLQSRNLVLRADFKLGRKRNTHFSSPLDFLDFVSNMDVCIKVNNLSKKLNIFIFNFINHKNWHSVKGLVYLAHPQDEFIVYP